MKAWTLMIQRNSMIPKSLMTKREIQLGVWTAIIKKYTVIPVLYYKLSSLSYPVLKKTEVSFWNRSFGLVYVEMNDIYALYSLFSLFILSRGTFYKIWILANFVLTPCLPSNISLPSISSSQFMSTWRKRQVSKETNLRIPKLKAFSSKFCHCASY